MLFHTKCVAEAATVRSVERQVADSQFPLNLEHSKLKMWTSISQWRLGEFFVFTGGGLTKLIRFQIFHVQFWRKSHRIAWLQVPFLEVSHKRWFSHRERERESEPVHEIALFFTRKVVQKVWINCCVSQVRSSTFFEDLSHDFFLGEPLLEIRLRKGMLLIVRALVPLCAHHL